MENTLPSALVALIYDLGRSLRQEFAHSHKDGGANILQRHALMLLGERTGITMKEFAEAMHVSAPSATTFIDRLIDLGWASRKRDTRNRKLVRLALTPSGKRMLERSITAKSAILHERINRLSPDDQRHLLRILKQFLGTEASRL